MGYKKIPGISIKREMCVSREKITKTSKQK